MNSVASVKAKLKNLSKETGKNMLEMLTMYGLERTIYRISISRFKENFTLKGGIFLYALYNRNYSRVTTDVDLLAQRISNDLGELADVFSEIFAIEADDPLRFDFSTLTVSPITEFKKYHGANVSITAFLDRTKIAVSIDVGFGDVVYPGRVEMVFPVIFNNDAPRIYAYSLCSSVAEKFEAIVSLAYDNSRFKDFYDLYVVSKTHDFDGAELSEAMKETFVNRHTSLSEIVAFEEGFADDPLRQSRWKSFVTKKKPVLPVTMHEAILQSQSFLGPVAEAVKNGRVMQGKWSHEQQQWV